MKISFSGDICVVNRLYKKSICREMESFFANVDYSFCCLEAPLLKGVTNAFVKAGPSLEQNCDVNHLLKLFTHVSLANNHIMDYGFVGLESTMSFLDEMNISYGGAGKNYQDAYTPIILDDGVTSVAVLCLAESQFGCLKYREQYYSYEGGYAWVFESNNARRIQRLKNMVDFVICFVHAGLEMEEIPLPEWRSCYRSLIDFGCDVVVSCHSHVIQGKECYKGKMIYYSIGNFFFNANNSDKRWYQSVTVNFDLKKNEPVHCEEMLTSFTIDGMINNDDSIRCRLEELSNILLNDEKYVDSVNKMVLDCWQKYYESYCSYPIKDNLQMKNCCIRLFYKLFKKYIWACIKPPVDYTMLYHNMIVDTHRFAISRAISLMRRTY